MSLQPTMDADDQALADIESEFAISSDSSAPDASLGSSAAEATPPQSASGQKNAPDADQEAETAKDAAQDSGDPKKASQEASGEEKAQGGGGGSILERLFGGEVEADADAAAAQAQPALEDEYGEDAVFLYEKERGGLGDKASDKRLALSAYKRQRELEQTIADLEREQEFALETARELLGLKDGESSLAFDEESERAKEMNRVAEQLGYDDVDHMQGDSPGHYEVAKQFAEARVKAAKAEFDKTRGDKAKVLDERLAAIRERAGAKEREWRENFEKRLEAVGPAIGKTSMERRYVTGYLGAEGADMPKTDEGRVALAKKALKADVAEYLRSGPRSDDVTAAAIMHLKSDKELWAEMESLWEKAYLKRQGKDGSAKATQTATGAPKRNTLGGGSLLDRENEMSADELDEAAMRDIHAFAGVPYEE